jgi:hypothetical protein
MRAIRLPAIDKTVTLAAYNQAVRRAKAAPAATFKTGLTTWWPDHRRRNHAAIPRRHDPTHQRRHSLQPERTSPMTDQNKSPPLLPCPFCGGAVQFEGTVFKWIQRTG